MNDEKDKGLDDFFRRGLEDPVENTGYMEDDWDRMEKMLDKPKKRGAIVYWLPVISSVAALMLLFLGWWAYKPKTTTAGHTDLQAIVKHQQPDTGKNGGAIQQQAVGKQTIPPATTIAAIINNGNSNGSNSKSKSFFTSSANGARLDTAGEVRNAGIERQAVEPLVAYSAAIHVDQASIEAGSAVTTLQITDRVAGVTVANKSPEGNKIKIKRQSTFHPQYALSVLAAPDVNGVGSFQQSKVGTNIGLGFSAAVSKKFTVSTGVLYSVKPYLTGFDNYHTAYKFSDNPVNVLADCRMLDIPLNIGYQLYNKHQNKLSIGTGLSSYIMLHENYTFNYADGYASGPANYTVPHSGKYFFGVANLNATYQRQLNEKVGISVQPYLKLPLTDIGYSQVRLQTTGVAVGITWNLNSLSKP